MCPDWHILVRGHGGGGLGYRLDDGAGLPGLSDGKGAGPLWQKRAGDAGENEAPQHRHGQDVLDDWLVPPALRKPKNHVLHLVVYPAAGLERLGLRRQGEVVEVGLEQPERLRGAR